MRPIVRYPLAGLLILVVIFAVGGSMAIYGDTFINPWLPLLLALATGLSTSLVMWKGWRGITDSDSRTFNSICHVATVTSVLTAAFYLGNYAWADTSTLHEEKAVVVSRYSETRHKSKRVGRRTVAGEPYKVYFVEVELADGRRKSLSASYARFRRIHTGDTLSLQVEEGALGFPVIKKNKLR